MQLLPQEALLCVCPTGYSAVESAVAAGVGGQFVMAHLRCGSDVDHLCMGEIFLWDGWKPTCAVPCLVVFYKTLSSSESNIFDSMTDDLSQDLRGPEQLASANATLAFSI